MTQPEQNNDTQPEDALEHDIAVDSNVADLSAVKIAELEKKLAEANDKMLRAVAEADNTRKRLEKERLDTAKFAVSSFARDLLPVADQLRRALDAIKPETREANPELKNIATGVEATERVLLGLFERNGIKKVSSLGQPFDPNLHEVIFETDVTDKPAGTILQEVECAYTLHDRLLRPGKVGVAKGGDEAGAKLDTQA